MPRIHLLVAIGCGPSIDVSNSASGSSSGGDGSSSAATTTTTTAANATETTWASEDTFAEGIIDAS